MCSKTRYLSINKKNRMRVIKTKCERRTGATRSVGIQNPFLTIETIIFRSVLWRRDATRRDASQPRPQCSIFIIMDGPYNGRARRTSPVKGFRLKDFSSCPCLDIATGRPRNDRLTSELSVTTKSKVSSKTLCLTTRRDCEIHLVQISSNK